MLGLHCSARAFSSCSELGLLSSCGVQTLGRGASIAVEHGLSCPTAVVESFQTRDQTSISRIGRQILNHWTTTEDLVPWYIT